MSNMTISATVGVKRGLLGRWSCRSPSNFGRFDPPLKKLMAFVPCRFSIQNSTAGKHVQMMNHGGACQQSPRFLPLMLQPSLSRLQHCAHHHHRSAPVLRRHTAVAQSLGTLIEAALNCSYTAVLVILWTTNGEHPSRRWRNVLLSARNQNICLA